MLVPIGIAVLATAAWAAQSKRSQAKQLTPQAKAERAVIYETLLNDVKDPVVLRRFSQAFRDEGANAEADMLMKRAILRELPPEVKKQRADAYKKGMASRDPQAIRALAEAFEETGATGAAQSLRDYAQALINHPTPVPQPEPEAEVPATTDTASIGGESKD